jgi:ABC-2 type transport system permease protein
MKRYLRLYWLFIKYSLIKALMYKENFVIWSMVSIGWSVLLVVFYGLLYANVDTIAGWTKPEVLLLQGYYFVLELLLWGMLWENMRTIPEKINKGTMDVELTKPINKQFLLSFKDVSFDNINNLIVGVLTIGYAIRLGEFEMTTRSIIFSGLALLVAGVYVYAGWFTTMCVAFWFDRIENLHYVFPSLRNFWKVPYPFYKGFVRVLLTFVVPVTLILTVPVEILLGRPSWWLLGVLALFALVTLKFSSWFFGRAIRHYSSAN